MFLSYFFEQLVKEDILCFKIYDFLNISDQIY